MKTCVPLTKLCIEWLKTQGVRVSFGDIIKTCDEEGCAHWDADKKMCAITEM